MEFAFFRRRRSKIIDDSGYELAVADRSQNSPSPDSTPSAEANAAAPDHAWKTLSLIQEAIRHSDLKAGVALTFTGVLATMTFDVVKEVGNSNGAFVFLAIVIGLILVLAGVLCGLTLNPRLHQTGVRNVSVNHLFFASIAENFSGRREAYVEALTLLTGEPTQLTAEIAQQVHANADIATKKSRVVNWAIRSVLIAAMLLALLAFLASVEIV